MALRYEISPHIKPVDSIRPPKAGYKYVEVLTEEEFEGLGLDIEDSIRDQMADLLEAESCYVDVYPEYIIGSIALPNRKDLKGERCLFSFYWTDQTLIFVDEENAATNTLSTVINTRLMDSMSTATCLYLFLRELIDSDHTWLGELEDRMELAEESIQDGGSDDAGDEISAYRRIAIRLTNYYRQLGEMALALASNDYGLMDPDDARQFNVVVSYADRLVGRAENIREYSLQLRELHQTQLDVQQNNTMQLLTIVTVILAPLTLIAGWFGMNFTNIPGVNTSWGFTVITIVGIVLTATLIAWFHKKKWL